ncbi:hypothetical protein N9V60_04725 [Flavobacteriaceae bacterium]|nr:hypothetical protein [Flavobacteriaceae bacterium]MDB2340766.1 hypothetical protein [Flavobacteriaceae bacterium]
MQKFAPILLAILFFIVSCKKEEMIESAETPENSIEEEAPENAITFSKHISSILSTNCNNCHGPSGDQTNYTSFQNAKQNVDAILNRIQREEGSSGFMPRNGNKLSDEDIALIQQWKDDGLFN